LRRGQRSRSAPAFLIDLPPITVQAYTGRFGRGKVFQERLLGHDRFDAGIGQHKSDPIARIGWIYRHVGSAGFQDAKEPDDCVERSLHAQADQIPTPNTQFAEVMGQLVGPLIEFEVRQLLILEDRCDGIRSTRRLRFYQLMHADLVRISGAGVVPVHQQLLPFFFTQQGRLPDLLLGIRQQASQQMFEVACHALDGGAIEQVRVVLPAPSQPVGVLGHKQRQVALRRFRFGIHWPQRESAEGQ
jgi:hypothetical protein